MAEVVSLLTVSETIRAAEDLRRKADASLTLARALVGVPDVAIASMAVLIGQFDTIAKLSAQLILDPNHSIVASDLDSALSAAGYLPELTTPTEEAAHGQG